MDNTSSPDDDLRARKAIFDQSIAGNIPFLQLHTITLVYPTKEGVTTHGAGILLAVGPRFFVVTAGHVVTDNTLPTYGVLTPAIRNMEETTLTPIHSEAHSDYDIGFLELSRSFMARLSPDSSPCTLSELTPRGWGREKRSTILAGPPSTLTTLSYDGPHRATLKASVMTYWTLPLQPAEWDSLRKPNAPEYRPLDPSVDIILDYDPQQTIQRSEGHNLPLPPPFGMSGGGIWDQDFKTGELWDASSPKLIGIQSSWFSKGKYLRGIQVIHALRLIYNRYPDLRQLLCDSYGTQHFTDCPPSSN